MHDFLDTLAQAARISIKSTYYEDVPHTKIVQASLKQEILQAKGAPIIAEVKGASPSKGIIKERISPEKVAKAMVRGGAIGISVLTEPIHFRGSLSYLMKIRTSVNLPLLMKDIIISPTQLDAAKQAGANAVLLIQALFDREYCETDINTMITEAHKRNLEVLLETHSKDEFRRAQESDADLIGINNRDLATLTVDLKVTRDILNTRVPKGRIILSESGITTAADVRFLRSCGSQAFLVGSAIMLADDIEAKVNELTQA